MTGINNLNSTSRVHDGVFNNSRNLGNIEYQQATTATATMQWRPAITSTSARYYYQDRNNANQWTLSDDYFPIHINVNGGSPLECVPLGDQFPKKETIFNFLNPDQIKFDQNGQFIPSEFYDVTSKCGVNGFSSLPFRLYQNSTDLRNTLGYDYIQKVFTTAAKVNNREQTTSDLAIGDSGFVGGVVLNSKTHNDSAQSFSAKVVVKNHVPFFVSDAKPKFSAWTNGYQFFYQLFTQANPQALAQFQISDFDLNQAKGYLDPSVVVNTNLGTLDFDVLKSEITKIINQPIDPEIDSNELVFPLVKVFFNVYQSLPNQATDIKTTLMAVANPQNWPTINNAINVADKNFLYSAFNDRQIAKFQTLWQNISDNHKKAIFTTIAQVVLAKINQVSSDVVNVRVNKINDLINSNQLWHVQNLLTNFQFSIDGQARTFEVPYNELASIVVSNANDQDTKNAINFKIVQTNPQSNRLAVNDLIIEEGNPLFYQDADNNDFTIFQNWLNLRKIKKSLSSAQEIPFVELLLRAKYSNQAIHDLFVKYLNSLNNVPNSFLTDNDNIAIRDYKDQIENGNWNYNNYRLDLNFLSVDFFKPLNTISTEFQKISQVPTPSYLNNKSADFVVVSPIYAKQFNKTPISDLAYNTFKTQVNSSNVTQPQWERIVSDFIADPQNDAHILRINNMNKIIVGIGNRADFAFPSISLLKLIPDANEDALVFVNDHGFHHFLSENPSAFKENYYSVRIPDKIKYLNLEEQFWHKLEQDLKPYINKTDGKYLFRPHDTSMRFSAAGFRNSFITNIVRVLYLVSYLLIAIVAVLVLFAVVVLIRRYSKINSVIFGNLNANGVSKINIIFSTMLFICIPSIIGPIVGYFIGLFTQNHLFNILNNYWFLSSNPSSFNFLTLLIYILVPIAILGLVTIVTGMITLKSSALVLMRENPIFKQTKFSLKINNLFNKFSPLWKFRLIVAVNSMSRILLLSSMSALMLVVLVFVFSNNNQFTKVSQSETNTKKFGYEIRYTTPSSATAQSPLLSYANAGQTYLNPINQKLDITYQAKRNDPTVHSKQIEFNKDNPLLVAANIDNFYQDLLANKPEVFTDFARDVTTNPQQAFQTLNSRVWFDPIKTNGWAKNTTSTHFLLRSYWDATNQYFKSLPLPRPEEANQKVFYYSSTASRTNINAAVVGAINGGNYNKEAIEKQQLLFQPDLNYNDHFYYSDYVPTVNEKSSINKVTNNPNPPLPDEDLSILAPDNTPLFAPLSALYETKQPLLNNVTPNNSGQFRSWIVHQNYDEYNSGLRTKNDDFRELKYNNNQTIKLPLLNRLYRDNANYFSISIDDNEELKLSDGFLKNRVITKLLLDHTIRINNFGLNLNINPWDKVLSVIQQSAPAIVPQINANHNQLIRRILNSRYAPYFVNRFMTMHPIQSSLDSFSDGNLYLDKPSYLIKPSDLQVGVNTIDANAINTNVNPNLSEQPLLVPGLYYLDSAKTLYIYLNPFKGNDNNPSNRYGIFAFLRPDFLYLVYALFSDPSFNSPQTGPTKLVFADSLATADYDVNKAWTVTGDLVVDAEYGAGITATDPKMEQFNTYHTRPNGDQTFTYLNGRVMVNGDDARIYGIKQDRRGSYISLNSNNTNINHLLYAEPTMVDGVPIYNIIVNQFAARKYNLSIGSILEFEVDNYSDRVRDLLNDRPVGKIAKFQVVGISDAYFNAAFFTSQKSANMILGLNPDYGFNGVYTYSTNNKLPLQFSNGLSVYSEVGAYSDLQFSPDSAAARGIFNTTATEYNSGIYRLNVFDIYKQKFQLSDAIASTDDLLKLLNARFGASALKPAIEQIDDSSTVNVLFDKLSITVNSLIAIVLIVLIPLLIIMVMMITSLVIDDLKQLSIVMIMLGFNNWENSVTVLTYLFPVLLLSVGVGLPLAFIFIDAYVNVIFSTISILLPVQVATWSLLTGVGVLLGIFTFAFVQSFIKLKRIFLPLAMKSAGF